MLINIKNSKDSLNVYGKTNVSKHKFGYNEKRTLGGKIKVAYGSKYESMTIEIAYLNEKDRAKLEKIYYEPEKVEITTETSDIYYMTILGDSLSYQVQYRESGEKYYTTTLRLSL